MGPRVFFGMMAALILGGFPVVRAAPPGLGLSFDVPVQFNGTWYLPAQTARWTGAGFSSDPYIPALVTPGANVTGLVWSASAGGLLFTADAAFTTLDGNQFRPGDVVLLKGGAYSIFLSAATLGLPPGTILDGLALDDRDRLVVTLAEPAQIGNSLFQPADLLVLNGSMLVMFWGGAAHGLSPDVNICGVELAGPDHLFLSFDAPTTLYGQTFGPGDIVENVGGTWQMYWHESRVPQEASLTDFYFTPGFPGRVPDGTGGSLPLRVEKWQQGTTLHLSWGASCGTEVLDYAVYEGSIDPPFENHIPLTCSTGGALSTDVTPGEKHRYYLVVPRNATSEGIYGNRSSGAEVPRSTSACVSYQNRTACP